MRRTRIFENCAVYSTYLRNRYRTGEVWIGFGGEQFANDRVETRLSGCNENRAPVVAGSIEVGFGTNHTSCTIDELFALAEAIEESSLIKIQIKRTIF